MDNKIKSSIMKIIEMLKKKNDKNNKNDERDENDDTDDTDETDDDDIDTINNAILFDAFEKVEKIAEKFEKIGEDYKLINNFFEELDRTITEPAVASGIVRDGFKWVKAIVFTGHSFEDLDKDQKKIATRLMNIFVKEARKTSSKLKKV